VLGLGLVGIPARLTEGCGRWIAIAVVLELLSAAGFVVFFKLVFGGSMGWAEGVSAALRALSASALLPAGGLIGPTIGVYTAGAERRSSSLLTRSTTTFVILTNAPGLIVLIALGLLLWLGFLSGSHQALLTLLPAALALALLGVTWAAARYPKRRRSQHTGDFSRRLSRPVQALSDGISDARALLCAADWKLVGALAYFAFDNAVLWAAFHAYGRTPGFGVVVMGYLIGSLGSALPLPAGLGVVDGGLIGALVLYGAAPASAAAAVLLYRAVSLSLPLLLGAIGWSSAPTAPRLYIAGSRASSFRPHDKAPTPGSRPSPCAADGRHAVPSQRPRPGTPVAPSSGTKLPARWSYH
jgi:uncharacterized membrane protein YbhN (UPF0104 family)